MAETLVKEKFKGTERAQARRTAMGEDKATKLPNRARGRKKPVITNKRGR